LRESDLIRKGYNALMRTLKNKNCGLEEVDEENMGLVDMDVDVEDMILMTMLLNLNLVSVHCFVCT